MNQPFKYAYGAPTKICTRCHNNKLTSEFRSNVMAHDKLAYWCIECQREVGRTRSHRKGARPMAQARDCALYLGVVVAERVLSTFFNNITRMRNGNPGYDFLCGRGFKIDAKSSCLKASHGTPSWGFHIAKNKIADYFLCLAFDSRESLEPQHVWLIPGKVVNNLTGIYISRTNRSLSKWHAYEKPLDKVIECCSEMRKIEEQA